MSKEEWKYLTNCLCCVQGTASTACCGFQIPRILLTGYIYTLHMIACDQLAIVIEFWLCFLWSGYLILYIWSGFHASEFSIWYSLPVGIFTQYVGVSTINNWLTFSCRVIVFGITENKSLLVPTSRIRNVCYLRKMSCLPHCFFHSDVAHSQLWSLSVLNTISIIMSLLMVSVRCYITQMVQILRNPSLCLEAQPWLMFISDAISSLPLFCYPGYGDRSAL